MTRERRAELRTIARAYAFDATFGDAPLIGSMCKAWAHAESRAEGRRVLAYFLTAYRHFGRRAARATVRLALKEVRNER